jgi:hypothetical protein
MNKNYSLAILEKDSDKFKVISWKSFEENMRERGTNNVVFMPIAEKYDQDSLAKLLTLSELMMDQYIIHVIDYYLIDHRNNKTMPCITFIFPNIKHVIVNTLIYSPLKYFILATISIYDKTLQIKKRSLTGKSKEFNYSAN